jgi:hypothetical protein
MALDRIHIHAERLFAQVHLPQQERKVVDRAEMLRVGAQHFFVTLARGIGAPERIEQQRPLVSERGARRASQPCLNLAKFRLARALIQCHRPRISRLRRGHLGRGRGRRRIRRDGLEHDRGFGDALHLRDVHHEAKPLARGPECERLE